MSDELVDEIEAINSIYGDGSLTPTEDESSATYILKLPADASSLRLQFPESYPTQSPLVLGTNHSSGGVKGAGARDLLLFKDVLAHIFQPGNVCLFDAVEEFTRRYEDLIPEEPQETPGQDDPLPTEELFPPPEWILSEVVIENKSTFIARVAKVSSVDEAKSHIAHLLASDKKVRMATHNITAWRIRGDKGAQYQDCDDDGETAAGGRMLHLMQVMDVWGVVVVVTRWYGGVKLGPRRFAVINGVARDGMVRAGVAKKG